MKRIPFKCSYGHVTIVSFEIRNETKSQIMCEKCLTELQENGVIIITIFQPVYSRFSNNHYKEAKMARRF